MLESVHLLPMCAGDDHPRALIAEPARLRAIAAEAELIASRAKFAGIVVNGVAAVLAPMIPTSPGDLDERRRRHVRPVDALARGDVRGCSMATIGNFASLARRFSAPRGSSSATSRGGRSLGAVVELVVADRRRRIAQLVVRAHHVGALGEVRLERALEHVAAVDQHHPAAVGRARGAQVRDGTREQRQRSIAPWKSFVPMIVSVTCLWAARWGAGAAAGAATVAGGLWSPAAGVIGRAGREHAIRTQIANETDLMWVRGTLPRIVAGGDRSCRPADPHLPKVALRSGPFGGSPHRIP